MAEIIEESRVSIVKLARADMNELLVKPLKEAGLLEFTPSQMTVREEGSEFIVTCRKVRGKK